MDKEDNSITEEEILQLNFFKLFGCSIEDYFFVDREENGKLIFSDCVNTIIESLSFDKSIFDSYQPNVAVEALARGVKRISDTAKPVIIPFFLSASKVPIFGGMKAKKDDIGISLGLLNIGKPVDETEEMQNLADQKFTEVLETMKDYKQYYQTPKMRLI